MSRIYFILCLLGLVCIACQPAASTSTSDSATGFDIDIQGDSIAVTIYSPWQKGLVLSTTYCQQSTTNYERIICTSATHMGFIHELGMTSKVVGVCRPERVYNLSEEDRERITDIGDDMQPSMEKILLLNPDLVILYTYAQGDPIPAQVEALGIPILYCNEWTETTPLARAEWIRVFGAVFGCQTKADSVFASICDAYERLRAMGDGQWAMGKSIMSGMSWRGTWYVPAGGTFMGNLFRDAGAQYRYADNPSTSSIPLTMEQTLQDFAEADVWVGCNAHTLAELQSIDEKHTWFKAFQTGQVYNFYRRTLPSGANDFWESGTVHPERILQDLQHILEGDTTQLYYVEKLK